jgi:hypothetical protein
VEMSVLVTIILYCISDNSLVLVNLRISGLLGSWKSVLLAIVFASKPSYAFGRITHLSCLVLG